MNLFIGPLVELLKWIEKQKDFLESKKRLKMSIRKEISNYVDSFEKLNIFSEILLDDLDQLDKEASGDLINSIIITCSDGVHLYGEIIHSYINLSVAIKEFSAMESLMEKLKANSFVYEFVCRVRDSVYEDKSIHLGAEYFRFIQAYEDKFRKVINNRDIYKSSELLDKYIYILNTKFQNILIVMSNRRRFKKQYIKQIFITELNYLSDAKKKFIIELSQDEIMQIIPEQFKMVITMFDKVAELEYRPKKWRYWNKQLTKDRFNYSQSF